MQPMTILGAIEIVFILWFGASLLIPVLKATGDDDDNR